MESLVKIYLRLLQETDAKMYRYLYRNIDWDENCIAIIGAKGVGKTTMLLQHIKTTFANKDEALLRVWTILGLPIILFLIWPMSSINSPLSQLGKRNQKHLR
jgi:GTPase SAR1 family protein